MDNNKGKFFEDGLYQEIRSRFAHMDDDPCVEGRRVFFDNGGGAMRLQAALDAFVETDAYPDCPERTSDASGIRLEEIWHKGIADAKIVFGAKSGQIATDFTATAVIMRIIEAVIENVPGTNVVVSAGDHGSTYDACEMFCKKFGKEFRVVKTNPKTGASDVEEFIKLVDENTCLLCFIYASNTSGAIYEAKEIIQKARAIKPDLYTILDAVQFAPHSVIDVEDLQVDAIDFTPYKFYGNRGLGLAYLSDRAAMLPHHRYAANPENHWENGSPASGQFAGFSAVVDYFCWLGSHFTDSTDRRELFVEGMTQMKYHERALLDRLLNGTDEISGLRNIEGVSLYVDIEDMTKRELLIGMGFDHLSIKDSGKVLYKHGIVTFPRTNDSMFSKRMINALEIEGLLRVTPCHCHGKEDVDYFLKVVAEIAKTKEMV
ncbi:aminotransferase class V-fold PLP-dependent enzyme [Chakrabartyella piscis]|uniref:aminotransferase class V-fold PLP-dependent enzyme n=1 Tax=Chakrabartyella piscis TaxID=2918914 RepID=UPI0029583B07|nr:aminotransferase class V-fold PLP-dependent enzyme [Chakrabartyella piscis]